MLGIGQIAKRIAELIRGTLPFAIVDNGTYSDGNARGQSFFSKIVSYPTITAADNAGHRIIIVRDGKYPGVTISNNHRLIIGSRQARIEGEDNAKPFDAAGKTHITIIGLYIEGVQGGSNGYNNVYLGSDAGMIGTEIGPSDSYGVQLAGTSYMAFCRITGPTDGWGVNVNGNATVLIGNTFAAYGFYIQTSAYVAMIGNILTASINSMQSDSGGQNSIFADNIYNGTITNNGSTTLADNVSY